MGEDNAAGSRTMNRRGMGCCLWVRAEEGRRVGELEGHLLRGKVQN